MAQQSEKKSPRRGPNVPFERLRIWQIQAVRDVLLVAVVAALVWLGYALRAVTVPLLVALLLAYLFEPLVARLSKHRKLSRPILVGGLLGSVGVALLTVLAVVIPVVVGQTAELVTKYQQGQFHETAVKLSGYLPEPWREQAGGLIKYLPGVPQTARVDVGESGEQPRSTGGLDNPPPAQESSDAGASVAVERSATRENQEARIRAIVRDELQRVSGLSSTSEGPDQQSQGWLGLAKGGAKAVSAVLARIIRLGFLAFLIPFYFFFFSVWYPSVVTFGRSLIPQSNRQRTFELFSKMDRVVAGFVRGRIVIALIMGAMLAVGWWIVGVPGSIALGFVVGVFCAVPYLGAVGIPIAVGLLFFNHLALPEADRTVWLGWWGVILWPTLVFGVVQVVEGYVLTPMIAGKATNLDPVTILVAVLAGGSIMGVYGMLLAIPVAACLKIICTDLLLPNVRAWTRGEVADPLPIDDGD